MLKVLSYWNLNQEIIRILSEYFKLKVLSYWNLNFFGSNIDEALRFLKYYHIGI